MRELNATAGTRAAKPKRRPPLLEGILPFDRSRLPTELIAGATLAALAMPEVTSIVEGADPPLKWFVLDAAAMGDIDYSGADTLRQVRSELDARGTRMVLCSVAPAVRTLLDAYGLIDQIRGANIFSTLQETLGAHPAASDASTEVPGSQPV